MGFRVNVHFSARCDGKCVAAWCTVVVPCTWLCWRRCTSARWRRRRADAQTRRHSGKPSARVAVRSGVLNGASGPQLDECSDWPAALRKRYIGAARSGVKETLQVLHSRRCGTQPTGGAGRHRHCVGRAALPRCCRKHLRALQRVQARRAARWDSGTIAPSRARCCWAVVGGRRVA